VTAPELESFIFTGHSRHSVDEKGRVAIARGFRKVLPPESNGRFILNLSHDSTIEIHPLSIWKLRGMATLSQLDPDEEDERAKLRTRLAYLTEVGMDRAYRVLIPRVMLDYAGLAPATECVLNGMGRYIELSSARDFDARMAQYVKNFNRVAAKRKGGPQDLIPDTTGN
jgi:MraZ protein